LPGFTTIRVPERGHCDIDAAVWRRMSALPQIWELIDRKIIFVTQAGRNIVRLNGTSYVGRLVLPEASIALEMVEKIPGALGALLGYATHKSFRIERQRSIASEPGSLMGLLIAEFAKGLQGYVNRGLDSEYEVQSKTGSLIGGRINLVKTIQLRARGMGYLIAFEKNNLTTNILKNRVLLAALRQVETLSRAVPIERSVVDKCRALSLAFSESLNPEVLWAARQSFALSAEHLAQDSDDEAERDLLTLADVILTGVSFDQSRLLAETVPRAWFVNLETLFETAVRTVLADCTGPQINVVGVKRGSRLAAPLFPQASSEMPAHPDLLLLEGGEAVAVGDVKYKLWQAEGDGRDDLYQVLSHAAAFRAPRAFLVYPHVVFGEHPYGMSAGGCRTWVFVVRIDALDADLKNIVRSMGLAPPSG